VLDELLAIERAKARLVEVTLTNRALVGHCCRVSLYTIVS
jgi:hypothetical protein